ncbi:MAG TPA: hypothetical protein VF773_01630 [Verrucomicrobiae bacterium]
MLSTAIVGASATVFQLAAQLPPGGAPKLDKPEPTISVERQIQDARKSAEAARASTAKKGSSGSSKSRSAEIRSFSFSDDSLRVNRPLIIKNGKVDAKVRDQLKEDLLVMCRIIEKSAQAHLADVHKAAGIDLLALGGGNRSVRTIYLDDYGVLFTLNVRIPLRNEEAAEEPQVKEVGLDEEWEETKNELFGQRRRAKKPVIANLPPYDEADVQDLRKELLDALGNAANIRNLKASDSITIAVSGPARVEGEVIQVMRSDEPDKGERSDKERSSRVTMHPKALDVFSVSDGETTTESTMILRVKKSDLDAVAKKNLGAEEFQAELGKVVTVQVY